MVAVITICTLGRYFVTSLLYEAFISIANATTSDKYSASKDLKNHYQEKALPNAAEIITAWNNLEKYLGETYGPKVNSYHELPFKQLFDGQIFTGSIDFVWETKEGVVLIDYKSYPGSKEDVVNPKDEHYAGMYAGQFECYERALTSAGKKVLGRMIYYHVIGVGVEI